MLEYHARLAKVSLEVRDVILLLFHLILVLLTQSEGSLPLGLLLLFFLLLLLVLPGQFPLLGAPQKLMTRQFFHPDDQLPSDLAPFRTGLMDDDLLGESELSQLFFYPDADPFGIEIDFEFSTIQVFRHLDHEDGEVGIFELLEAELEPALVALSDLPVFGIHLDRLLGLELLRIAFSFLFLLVLRLLLVHLATEFSGVGGFLLCLLFFSHMLLKFLPLPLVMFLLSQHQLSLLDCLEKRRLETGKQLLGFYFLGGGHHLPVVGLQARAVSQNVVFASFPVLAGVSSQVDLLETGQFGETDDAVVELGHVHKVDCHVQFLETFAALDVLNPGDVVECYIEVLQLLELTEVLQLVDDVVLEVENLEVAAEDIEVFYFDEILLVKRELSGGGSTSSRVVSLPSLC